MTRHTYYLAETDTVHGTDPQRADLLRRIWRRYGVPHPTHYDGVSVFDTDGRTTVRLVRRNLTQGGTITVVRDLTDEEIVEARHDA